MNEVTDGFGNSWPRCGLNECGLHVVRPGKVQCWCDDAKGEVLALRRHSADQGLTLATLCDLILGEEASDRSDTALIRGASVLVRGRDELLHEMQRLRNEVARLNNQTNWVCTCGGTDCAGQKENAALRELTSTLGAPNHINIPVEKWRELREDKERLDFLGQTKCAYYYEGPCCWRINEDKNTDGDTLRDALDAARKEAQP